MAEIRGPATAEQTSLSTYAKRKAGTGLQESGRSGPAKRIKTDIPAAEKISTQSDKPSGKGVSESSGPSGLPRKHQVNVQNGIYAAERLSCSFEVTHSINFILRGEIYSLKSLTPGSRFHRRIFQERCYTLHGQIGKASFEPGDSTSSTIYPISSSSSSPSRGSIWPAGVSSPSSRGRLSTH